MMGMNRMFTMMLGLAMMDVLQSDCADVLTGTEQRELIALAAQFMRGDPTVTPKQEKLVNKIMDRNGIAH